MIRSQNYFPVTIALCCMLVVVYCAMILNGVSFIDPHVSDLLNWGASFDAFVEKGEGWRLLTSGFVHFGIIHLAVNVTALAVLGRDFEKRYSSYALLIVFLTGILVASIGSFYWNIFLVSCGASGAIMAIAGCQLMGLIFFPYVNQNRRVIEFAHLVFVVLLNIGLGLFMDIIDNAAHIAGLIWGIVTGLIIFPFQLRAKWISGVRFSMVLLLAVSLFFIVVNHQEKHRFWYYTMFNSFIKNDAQTVELLNSNSGPESPLVSMAGLNEASDVWNKNMEMLKLFNNPPSELEPDLDIMKQVFYLRNRSLLYMKNYIATADLIYVDSIQTSNEAIRNLPPLKYWLVFEKTDHKQSDESDTVQTFENTTWYDSTWKETSKEKAVFYRSGNTDVHGNFHGAVKDYYLNGRIQMKGFYERNVENGLFFYYNENGTYATYGKYLNGYKIGNWIYYNEDGIRMYEITYTETDELITNSWNIHGVPELIGGEGAMNFYFPDGKISEKGNLVQGKKTGIWEGFYRNGDLYFTEIYKNGKLVKGRSYNKTGDQFVYDKTSESPSVYGGVEVWNQYLDSELKYPERAKKSDFSGRSVVKVTIGEKGQIISIETLRKIGFDCDEEAMRVIKNWKKFVPGKIRGQFATKDLYISIDFPNKNQR